MTTAMTVRLYKVGRLVPYLKCITSKSVGEREAYSMVSVHVGQLD